MRKYVRFNNDGDQELEPDTHLDHPIIDATLCGLTLDGDSHTAGSFHYVQYGYITCDHCIAIIKACRGIRTK